MTRMNLTQATNIASKMLAPYVPVPTTVVDEYVLVAMIKGVAHYYDAGILPSDSIEVTK